jgi:hypothetical protein
MSNRGTELSLQVSPRSTVVILESTSAASVPLLSSRRAVLLSGCTTCQTVLVNTTKNGKDNLEKGP